MATSKRPPPNPKRQAQERKNPDICEALFVCYRKMDGKIASRTYELAAEKGEIPAENFTELVEWIDARNAIANEISRIKAERQIKAEAAAAAEAAKTTEEGESK